MKITLRVLAIVGILLLLVVGTILGVKYYLKKGTYPKLSPTKQKETNPLDLRPAVIARLEQLVLTGTDSLYTLNIDSLFVDARSGTVTIKNVTLSPDSNVLSVWTKDKRLPDDVYKITFPVLSISGVTLADLAHSDQLSLHTVYCDHPNVDVWHKLQPYNATKRGQNKNSSLYGRLKGLMKRLTLDSASVRYATIVAHEKGDTTTYRAVSLLLSSIIIDSAAEYDEHRFLFAKGGAVQARDLRLRAGAGQYTLDIGSLNIDAVGKTAELSQLSIMPRGGREVYLKQHKTRKEVYEIKAPSVVVHNADWWSAMHGDNIVADNATISGLHFLVFVDTRMPVSGTPGKKNNFPQQILEALTTRVWLKTVEIKDATVAYEEYTRTTGRQSTLSFTKVNGTLEGITNIPEEEAKVGKGRLKATARFMGAVPMSTEIDLLLPPASRGGFTASVSLGAVTPDIVNPIAEDMGMVHIKTGTVSSVSVHIKGNNDALSGTITIPYTDLDIIPLKKTEDSTDPQKQKPLLNFFGNLLVIKKNNPSRFGKLRSETFQLDRPKSSSFFNFIWTGTKLGLAKTVGVPKGLVK